MIGLRLGGIRRIGLIEQLLNAEQNLFDRNRGAPVFLLVQNRQTDGARGKDVRMEEGRIEATLGRHRGIVVLEEDLHVVQATLPQGACLARNGTVPLLQIECAILLSSGLGHESKGMVFAPVFALLRQPGQGDVSHFERRFEKEGEGELLGGGS